MRRPPHAARSNTLALAFFSRIEPAGPKRLPRFPSLLGGPPDLPSSEVGRGHQIAMHRAVYARKGMQLSRDIRSDTNV